MLPLVLTFASSLDNIYTPCYCHPAPEIVSRLEQKLGVKNIFRTDKNGTVEFITDGERLWVKKEK